MSQKDHGRIFIKIKMENNKIKGGLKNGKRLLHN